MLDWQWEKILQYKSPYTDDDMRIIPRDYALIYAPGLDASSTSYVWVNKAQSTGGNMLT